MEEKLLQILTKNFYPLGEMDDDKTCAKEIADVYDLFIEWLCSNVVFDLLAVRQYTIFTNEHTMKAMTLNEAFNYWWDNVKEKS